MARVAFMPTESGSWQVLMARVLMIPRMPAPSSQRAGKTTRDPVVTGTLGPRKPEVPRPRKPCDWLLRLSGAQDASSHRTHFQRSS